MLLTTVGAVPSIRIAMFVCVFVCFFVSTSLCHFARHAIWLAQAKLSFRIVLRQLCLLCCIVFLLRVWHTQNTQKRKRPRRRRRQMKNIGRTGPQSSLSYIRLELSYTCASQVATNVCAQFSPLSALHRHLLLRFVSVVLCHLWRLHTIQLLRILFFFHSILSAWCALLVHATYCALLA